MPQATQPTTAPPGLRLLTNLITYTLSAVYITAGLCKLLPSLPPHEHLRSQAPHWLRALSPSQNPALTADALLTLVGIAELLGGLALPLLPQIAYALIALMAAAVYTHFVMDGARLTAEATPAAVLAGLLAVSVALRARVAAPRVEAAAKEE